MQDAHKTNVISLGTCRACEAIVRPGSDFCYNCGGKLGDPHVDTQETTAPIPEPVSELAVLSANGTLRNGPGVKVDQNSAHQRRARNPRPRSSEPVQVVWKREEGVGIGFIVLTISAAIFAILMIAIAYYLR